MSAIEIAVQASQSLEKALAALGATGKGLHEKTESVSAYLPQDLVKRLHWIATIRNKVVHEGAGIHNPAEFQQAVQQSLQQIQVAAARARNSRSMPRRARRRFSWIYPLLLVLIGAALTHPYWRQPLYRLTHGSSVFAAQTKPNGIAGSPHLFGAVLATATRATLTATLLRAGLQQVTTASPWYQTYRLTNQLPGATRLRVWYTQSGRFAMAQYQFPAFMDTQKVEQVIHLVADKYGKPDHESGDWNLGPVHAWWKRPDHFELRVFRGWPSTTTFLQIIDWTTYPQLQREQRASLQAHTQDREQQHAAAL